MSEKQVFDYLLTNLNFYHLIYKFTGINKSKTLATPGNLHIIKYQFKEFEKMVVEILTS